jgi:hypothetical protein
MGTPLTANVTLLGLETEVDDPAEWQHPIEACIHLNPDGDDAELFDASYTDNIVARSYPNRDRFVLAPEQHCRLTPNQSRALDVRYCFGLNLHPGPPHVFTPLLSDNELPSLAQVHGLTGKLAMPHEFGHHTAVVAGLFLSAGGAPRITSRSHP